MGNRRRTITAAAATLATSIGLYPIFTGQSWFWAGAGAVGTVAGAGALTRLRRLPVLACLLGGLVALLLYLNLAFAHGESLAGLIPTPSSLAYLWDLAQQGTSEASRYAPPVPELNGMMVLAAGGIGLTALLVDTIAVRLRSAAFAGLPLLLLFTEPFTLSVTRGALGTTTVFCLAAAGYLALLAAEGRERIGEWERPGSSAVSDVSGASDEARPPDTRALAAAGRRVGAVSVVVALCVPLFVPGLHTTRLFGGGSPGIGGNGSGGINGILGFPNPESQLSGELRSKAAQPVLSYTSTAAEPDYLQIYVLSDLTTSGWQFARMQPLVPAGSSVPAPPGLTVGAAGQTVTTHIAIGKDVAQDEFAALPAPYPPVKVSAAGVQADRDSLMLFHNGTPLGGLNYTVTSLDVTPDEQALATAPAAPKDITDRYLSVPAAYDPLRDQAQSITANATTPYAKAVALQDWFADGNFSYSLSTPAISNASGLENFVDVTQTGYCQQFSFAMAVMARLLGIPSRVVYGFTQGTSQHDGTWLVTTHDAHAWPELYFQGFGWLRFEPTPGGGDGQGTATAPAYTATPSDPSAVPSFSPLPNASNAAGSPGKGNNGVNPNHGHQVGGNDGNSGGTQAATATGGPNSWELAGISILGLLALAAVAPSCARTVIRRRRWSRLGAGPGRPTASAIRSADAAWRELCDDLADYRAGYRPSESPRALARRITGELELSADAAEALHRITMAAERARYSAHPASGATLRRDSAMVRRAIAASVPRGTRWLARAYPSSVVTPTTFMIGQFTDVFGRFGPGQIKIGVGRLRGRTAP